MTLAALAALLAFAPAVGLAQVQGGERTGSGPGDVAPDSESVTDPLDRAALGMTLTQLSLLLRLQGRNTEALDTAARASQIMAMAGAEGETTIRLATKFREETLGPEHPSVARMLQPLAFLLEAQGRYGDAAVVWRRAIEILERSRAPASLDLAASLEAYAAFLAKVGRESEARGAEARAAAIRGR